MATKRDQSRKRVVDALNRARGMELQAISQYMNHHYDLDNMDYGEIAVNMKLIAVDEMRHAEMFADRIKELDAEPTAELAGKPERDGEVGRIFAADTDLEDGAIAAYNRFLLTCRESGDSTSVKLLEQIIDDEQIHFNYFVNVRDHIGRLGESYLARIAGTPSASGITYQGFVARQQAGGTATA